MEVVTISVDVSPPDSRFVIIRKDGRRYGCVRTAWALTGCKIIDRDRRRESMESLRRMIGNRKVSGVTRVRGMKKPFE
jgi:hypothetical protein